jgi:hypothetical protein
MSDADPKRSPIIWRGNGGYGDTGLFPLFCTCSGIATTQPAGSMVLARMVEAVGGSRKTGEHFR